jgi:hypothetical protein
MGGIELEESPILIQSFVKRFKYVTTTTEYSHIKLIVISYILST